jgi:hypothetical protein
VGTVLLFVALLVAVDLSYRRWVRRTSSRRRSRVVIDLASAERATSAGTAPVNDAAPENDAGLENDAAIIPMPPRDAPSRHARRSG